MYKLHFIRGINAKTLFIRAAGAGQASQVIA